MEPWIGQDHNLGDMLREIADESQDPQLVSQIPCGGQHKNAAAAFLWARPNRELVLGGCFRCLYQNEPAISVAASPFKAIADEAKLSPFLFLYGISGLSGDHLSNVVVHVIRQRG